jgi:hypothetical protein
MHIKITLLQHACAEHTQFISMQSVDSVQNKELLWSTLQESGAFAGLTREQFQPAQLAFDRSVQQASRTMTGSLSVINKHIIRQFVQTELPVLRSPGTGINATPVAPKKKKIEMVYRAEDLQTERANEFERQLRDKQAEMDSFLTLKKPTDVSFTDAAVADDKPIGEEMSRLIANELAARERELVQLKPEDIEKAQQWIGATADNAANVTLSNVPSKKSVSFSNINTSMTNVVEEEDEVEQYNPEYNENPTNEFMNGENFEETDFIFSKFKRISEPSTDMGVPESSAASLSNASITVQQLHDRLIAIEKQMNANHSEIMAHLKGI